MAKLLRARSLLLLVLSILIFTLCMVFCVEWSYVERLKKEDHLLLIPGSIVSTDAIASNHFSNFSRHISRPISVGEVSFDNVKGDIYSILRVRKQYELRVEKTIQELWWYIRKRLNVIKEESINEHKDTYFKDVLKDIEHRYDTLRWRYDQLNNVYSDTEPFQLNWKYWQTNISIETRSLIRKRINYLQNPADCKSAKKLVCHVAKTCGFGCQIHHVSYCFIMAYATKRTLILDSSNWKYSPNGWNAVFQPVSSTCSGGVSATNQFSMTSQALAVSLPPIDNLNPRPLQLPMAIPRDLSDRLLSFHGFPFTWFIAQFLSYLMRPSDDLKMYIHEKKVSLGLMNKDMPILGIHVRRTDKKVEARYHDINEYIQHVEEWYEWYELTKGLKGIERRIYIATDEPDVIKDAKSRYPSYVFFYDTGISSLASKTGTRYSASSLFGVIFDVTVLSECDYIVCTFSSQVCRVAYELMQNKHIDASKKYYSLDDIYYFGGQQAHDVVAIEDNNPLKQYNQVPFKTGDHLGIAGNEKNGYSVGVHRRTLVRGDYPSYKVEEHIQIADFPSYEELN